MIQLRKLTIDYIEMAMKVTFQKYFDFGDPDIVYISKEEFDEAIN